MIPLSFFALTSFLAFLALWFRIAWRELLARADTVISAKQQLEAHQLQLVQLAVKLSGDDATSSLARSQDIYRQSVELYNQALAKPYNIIPGWLMGFRFKSVMDT